MGGRTAHHTNACREFPGSTAADAPLTSRQAAVCFEVVRQSEFHIDFRGGDLHESHVVHTIYPKREEDPELDAKAEDIEQQPVLSAADLAVKTLSIVVTGGTSPYSYEWFRNDILVEGSNGPDLVLTEEQLSTGAEYHCHVISALGSTLWSEGVRVAARPAAEPFPAPAGVVDEQVYETVATFAFVGGLSGGLFIAVLAWIARACSKKDSGDSSAAISEGLLAHVR